MTNKTTFGIIAATAILAIVLAPTAAANDLVAYKAPGGDGECKASATWTPENTGIPRIHNGTLSWATGITYSVSLRCLPPL